MRSRAAYQLFGNGTNLSAARVTDALGIVPDHAAEAGTRRGPRSPVRTKSLWEVASAARPEAAELAECLHRLLDRLEPVATAIWQLTNEGYTARWFCFLGSNAFEHAAVLDRALLRRTSGLPGDMLLDLYPNEGLDEGERP